jgi:hypothetical protein
MNEKRKKSENIIIEDTEKRNWKDILVLFEKCQEEQISINLKVASPK